jgi:hypothetical protein
MLNYNTELIQIPNEVHISFGVIVPCFFCDDGLFATNVLHLVVSLLDL